jgi:uncharacterized membrane-anchored protein YjiN (DUF445 family)
MNTAIQQAGLTRMKVFSTLLLVFMALLYVVSRYLEMSYPWMGFIRAFSEASMIGALADWFAVVALFKHPLGLPIPHTAIIKKHKDKFGKALAMFIKNNFLSRNTLESRLRKIDAAMWFGKVLSNKETVRKVADRTAAYLVHILDGFDDRQIKTLTTDLIMKNVRSLKIWPLIGDILTIVMKDRKHQVLLDEVLSVLARIIEDNKDTLRQNTRNNYPWWVPDFIDDMVFNKMVVKFMEAITDIQGNKEHGLRQRFDAIAGEFIENLKHSESFAEKGDALAQGFFSDPAVVSYLNDLWTHIRDKLKADLMEIDSDLRKRIENGVYLFGSNLIENPHIREKLNLWISTSLIDYAEEYADSIIAIISDTIEDWDAEKTSRTIELYVGKDLQWIRINGTVVGGLVGLVIYILSEIFRR